MPESEIIRKRTERILSQYLTDPRPNLSVKVKPPKPDSEICQECIIPTLVSYQASQLLDRTLNVISVRVGRHSAVLLEVEESYNGKRILPDGETECHILNDQRRSRSRLKPSAQNPGGRALPDVSLSSDAPCVKNSLRFR